MTLIKAGHLECVREILKADVDVNVTDKDGNIPLMAAVDFELQIFTIELLLKGAKINIRNIHGKTAVDMAVTHQHAEFQGEQSKQLPRKRFTEISGFTDEVFNAGGKIDDIYGDATQILKILIAAGAETRELTLFEDEHTFQDLIRQSIRDHLKHIHPESNLFHVISQLGLPFMLQSYLLL